VFTGEGYIVVNDDANAVRAEKKRRNSEEIKRKAVRNNVKEHFQVEGMFLAVSLKIWNSVIKLPTANIVQFHFMIFVSYDLKLSLSY
jgi:hypothetical protein